MQNRARRGFISFQKSTLDIRVNNDLRSLLDHTLTPVFPHAHVDHGDAQTRPRGSPRRDHRARMHRPQPLSAPSKTSSAQITMTARRHQPWPPSSSGATEMTGDELAGSIHSGADVVPHLVKFYAPWCSKCRQMSGDFDAAADRLTRGVNAGTNKFVVASVAEASTGARKLFEDLEIKAYPHVAMFYKRGRCSRTRGRTGRPGRSWRLRRGTRRVPCEGVCHLAGRDDGEHVTIGPRAWAVAQGTRGPSP